MNIFRMFLHLFNFLLLFIQVVKICTDHVLAKKSTVFLDTVSVSAFQPTSCKCIISPFKYKVGYTFTVYGQNYPKGMEFEINNIVIKETASRKSTYLIGETPIYFSTAEGHRNGGTCVIVDTDDSSFFNITCMKSTILVTDTTATDTSRAITTEISKGNITTPVTTTGTTAEASRKGSKTTLAQSRSNGPDSSTKTTVIVVPVVVGVLLILAAAVLLLVYVRRRRFVKDTKRHEQEPCMPVSEQSQGQQNNPESEESNINISVNAYERLNMYANDKLAGEMYEQLNADKTGEYQEMSDVVTDSRNQNRNVTKQVNLEDTEKSPTPSKGRLKGQVKGQGNNSNGDDRDIEIPSNAYEKLNMYVNDNLAGEMYEQLDTNQDGDYRGKHVPRKKDRPGNKSEQKTKTNEQAFAVYANAK
ncbi:uncharacterized protein LOC123552539 isoform X2 [Mercenaria mercenaria]|uniref:uncharacterized protein LOC123552539 isoform X2 n=1 Tax=Mercenaria mercenaria TaxID=6596 RepID=UPI00234FA453|nr:uncharacterized protein LOC123552539 isoform X2 [Mercenaria mercenaria]